MPASVIYRLFILSLILFVGWRCTSKVQLPQQKIGDSINETKACDYILFTYLGRVPEKSKQFAAESDLGRFFMLGEVNIDPDKEFIVDEVHFRKYIRKHIPDKNAEGYGAFDWETPLKILKKDAIESESFKSLEHEFIKAYQIAKEERPNIKWGYYALPFREYWNRGEVWKNRNKKLAKILATTDVIYPSVYDFYQDSAPLAGRKMDSLYVNDNIQEALKFGKQLNKPVIPFFWHRWHAKPERGGMQRIPWKEFGPHIKAALDAKVGNEHIFGLVWWGADDYFHSRKSKAIVEESKTYPDFDTYNNEVIIETTTNILNLVNEHCRSTN